MQFVSIDIGCGPSKSPKAKFGVDLIPCPGVDVVCNFEKSLPFADNSIDLVVTRHALEHIANLEQLLREIVRAVKPHGIVEVTVPHFSNPLGYSDYTHRRFFGLYTFDYFSRAKDRHWAVPSYSNDIWFKILKKRLCFKNLSILGPVAEWIFNRSEYSLYVYESKFSWFLPCFEIEFHLKVDK